MQTPQQYTTKQIADALGASERAIYRRATREDWPFSKRSGRGGGKVFSPEQLPADVRRVLAVVAAGALAESGHGAVAVPSGVGIAAGAVPPEQYHQAGLDRYAVVQAWRAHVVDAGWGQKGKATEGFLFAFNAGHILPHIHARLGAVAVATLYAWDKKLKNHDDNYLILCDRNGVWTEGKAPELGQIGYEAEEVFLRCWLHPNRPSYRLAYRATSAILKDRGHETVPGYHSFYRFAKRYEKTNRDVVVLARDGEKALKDQVLSYISRDHAALRVGQCLVADGHDLNFEVLHPVTGRPARLKLIVFYDWASNLPVGWQIMPTEDSVAISAAFRAACLRLGR
ncbi:DNA-binding domain-containing protein, partial [Desulfovibrio inopinatus]|uniref:DNA-binding domain-containing protein n=1 Tax=Desulfovibrio inopinatus TaxID=102109 RepID=UPI0005547524